MAQQITQFKGYPAAPTAEVHPHITLGYFNDTIANGGNAYIKEGTVSYPAADDWLHTKNQTFNISGLVGHIDGATLNILVSVNGLIWDLYSALYLPGLYPFFYENIKIPGWSVKFRLYNNALANNLIETTIEGRAY